MILEIIIISILGTILHFTYELSNHNKFVALFSAVNESTWEHIKIALSASLFYSVIDLALYGTNPSYFLAKFLSLLVIIVLMPLIFYSYTSITKKSILPVDILSFYIVIIISQIVFYKVLGLENISFFYQYIGIIGTFIIFAFYMRATLLPIKNFIFKDPITKKYGLNGHSNIEHK